MTVPRPEYPRPQFARREWLNLNGEWQFEIDPGDSGLERGVRERELSERITVPFAPESRAVRDRGRRLPRSRLVPPTTVTIPAEWAGQRTSLLHFQAVDHDATVWVERRRGGAAPRRLHAVQRRPRRGGQPGEEATIVVRARDTRHGPQARGKQSTWYANHGCHYTRTTGIWQTVWLEPVPDVHLRRPRITPDRGRVRLPPRRAAVRPTGRLAPGPRDADGRRRATSPPPRSAPTSTSPPRLTLPIPADRVAAVGHGRSAPVRRTPRAARRRRHRRGHRGQLRRAALGRRSTARRSCSTASRSSSGSCSTRATTRTA